MKPSPLIARIIALLFFAGLISCFIAYRTGAFDTPVSEKKYTPAENIEPALAAENSLEPIDIDSPPSVHFRSIMSSSSKSGFVFDTSIVRLFDEPLDLAVKKGKDSTARQTKRKYNLLMSSSKSITVPAPEADTLKKN